MKNLFDSPRGPQVDSVHNPSLDGIRGIAILSVLLFHTTLYSGTNSTGWTDQIYARITGFGWSGVDLFFVLSGFLITGILYDSKHSRHYFRNFYFRRFFRIFPLYYVFLFVYFFVIPRFFAIGNEFNVLPQDRVWYWTYLTNVWIAIKGWPQASAIGHFWSLAVEEQFYLFWPLIVLLCSGKGLIRICLAFMIGSLALRIVLVNLELRAAATVLTFARMDALASGGLIAVLIRDHRSVTPIRKAAPLIAIGAGMLLVALLLFTPISSASHPWVQTAGYSLFNCFYGAFILLGVTFPQDAVIQRGFGHPILRFFGKYSYAIYVLHHPIVFVVRRLFTPQLFHFGDSRLPGIFLFGIIVTLASSICAIVSWHLIESPFLKLKRFFPYENKAKQPAL